MKYYKTFENILQPFWNIKNGCFIFRVMVVLFLYLVCTYIRIVNTFKYTTILLVRLSTFVVANSSYNVAISLF